MAQEAEIMALNPILWTGIIELCVIHPVHVCIGLIHAIKLAIHIQRRTS